jgi:hypothetical protein
MKDLIIPNQLPLHIVALSGETRELIADLERRSAAITTISSDAEMKCADDLVKQATALKNAIEDERKRHKAPILDLGRAMDDAAGEAIAPLAGIKVDLGKIIVAYTKAENERRQREYEKQMEAARLAKEEADRKAAEAALADDPPPEDMPPPDEQTVIIPEVLPPPPPRVLKSASVTQRIIKDVVIDDATLVPIAIGGAMLRPVDDKIVKKLLEAGIEVPGCRLVPRQTIAGKG